MLGGKSIPTHPRKLLRAYTAIPTAASIQRQKTRATNLRCLSRVFRNQRTSMALGWASVCLTQPVLGVPTNLPSSFLHRTTSQGCFYQPPQDPGAAWKPTIAVKFSRSEDRNFYLCWIQPHLCPHGAGQKERVFEILLVCLEHNSEQLRAQQCFVLSQHKQLHYSLLHSRYPTARTHYKCLKPKNNIARWRACYHSSAVDTDVKG